MSDVDSTCGSALMLDSQNFGQDRSLEPRAASRTRTLQSASTYREHRDQMMACTEASRTSVSTSPRAIYTSLRCAAYTTCSEGGFVVDDGID
jgi:hypothetical protein